MSTNVIRGMDHVGITVSDIDEATRFFSDAFGAEVIYDSVSPSDDDVKGEETENILNLFPGTKITTVRMMKLKHGPGLELFEMKGPEQSQPVRPSDYGLQ
ncbi:VOC family protein, partial [Pantoea agglomerans]